MAGAEVGSGHGGGRGTAAKQADESARKEADRRDPEQPHVGVAAGGSIIAR